MPIMLWMRQSLWMPALQVLLLMRQIDVLLTMSVCCVVVVATILWLVRGHLVSCVLVRWFC